MKPTLKSIVNGRKQRLSLLASFIFMLALNTLNAQYGAWQYRVPIRIIDNSGISKTNYQVKVELNTAALVSAGQMNASGNDLRFGSCTNPSAYNFWIESGMNTTSTDIWVLLPSLPANDTATLFMYYGNAAAANESNFDSTFTVASRLIVSTGTVVLAGVNNFSWFEIQPGATVQVTQEDILQINARKIKISGTLDGMGKGEIAAVYPTSWGGAPSGKGSCGGGGGAHGGNGGRGSGDTIAPSTCNPGIAGLSTGSATFNIIDYGYSGGNTPGASGGNGGGALTLIANNIEISGIINMNGVPGAATNPVYGGSGGGAGGGILINANKVSISGTGQLLAKGGKGGDKPTFFGGGGAGGGRIKIFYDDQYINSGIMDVSPGVAGLYGGAQINPPDPGQPGTIYTDGSFNAGEPTVIISPSSTFALTSSDPDNSICAGTSVTFTASSGYSNYKFMKNTGTVLQNGASNMYTTTTLADNDTIYAIVAFDGCPDTSNAIIMNVDNPPVSTASNTGPYCETQTIQLNSSGGGTYAWSGPGGYSDATQNPSIPSSTVAMSGDYTVVVTGPSGCTSSSTTTVLVNPAPTASATNTGPYCEGATIQLNSVGGSATDDWAGPLGYFQLDTQNPTIPSSTTSMSGTYTVLVTNGSGCTATATTNVVVNANPIATASNTGPYCAGATIQLNSTGGLGSLWNGPGGYSSMTPNPTIPGSTVAMSGVYTVTVANASACTATATTTVVVNPTPTASATNTGPYCVGATIQLNSVGGTATDDWSGPAGYSQTDMQNPSIPGATLAMSGIYTVTVTNGSGCSATSTTSVTVNTTPTAAASNTGPYCEGATIQLNSVGGTANDDWTGPGGYVQNDTQNPTIGSATIAMSGVYTVTVTLGGGCSASATTTVVVNANPIATASNTGPYCEGATIQLSSVGGSATDDWAGPGGYSQANTQNPSIINSTIGMAGVYTVLVTNGSGCTATATTNVVVNANPIATATNTGPYCEGATIQLNSVGGTATDDWSGPGGYIESDTQNPTIAGSTTSMSGVYTVTTTNGSGCSATATTTVVVNSLPVATAASNSPICTGENLDLTSSGGLDYDWTGPGGYSQNDTQNPSIPGATPSNSGTYTVIVTDGNGCSNTATTDVVVNSNLAITASSNSPVCEGGNIDLTVTTVSGGMYGWSGPGGFTSTVQNPSIASATTSMSGMYTVVATNAGGCTGTATVNVVVNPSPVVSASNDGPVCEGATLNLSATGGVDYDWTGPSGYIQNDMQNPSIGSITTAGTGTYVVTVTDGAGCSATASTTATVNPNPVTPTIAQSGDTLIASPGAGFTYQWYLDGNLIAGATSSTYLPVTNGSYVVVITNGNGCSSSSAEFFSNLSVDESGTGISVNLYPNPASEKVNISFTQPVSGMIELIDINGRTVNTWKIQDAQTMMSLEIVGFASGIYQLKISTGLSVHYKKLIIK